MGNGNHQAHTNVMTYERIDNSKKFDGRTRESHELRYKIASNFIGNKDIVLDAGCGTGYGREILKPYLVYIGYDKNILRKKDTKKYTFIKHDFEWESPETITGWFIPNWPVDVFVGLEIIEHLNDTDATFLMFKRISPKLIILSTPHLKCPIGGNKFHYRHYGMDELIDSFWNIGYKPKRAELIYFGAGLCNFMVMGRR